MNYLNLGNQSIPVCTLIWDPRLYTSWLKMCDYFNFTAFENPSSVHCSCMINCIQPLYCSEWTISLLLMHHSFVQVWVRWIGHSTVSLVELTAVKPLKEGIKHRTRYGKKIPKKLQESVNQALKLLKKQQTNKVPWQCLQFSHVRLIKRFHIARIHFEQQPLPPSLVYVLENLMI